MYFIRVVHSYDDMFQFDLLSCSCMIYIYECIMCMQMFTHDKCVIRKYVSRYLAVYAFVCYACTIYMAHKELHWWWATTASSFGSLPLVSLRLLMANSKTTTAGTRTRPIDVCITQGYERMLLACSTFNTHFIGPLHCPWMGTVWKCLKHNLRHGVPLTNWSCFRPLLLVSGRRRRKPRPGKDDKTRFAAELPRGVRSGACIGGLHQAGCKSGKSMVQMLVRVAARWHLDFAVFATPGQSEHKICAVFRKKDVPASKARRERHWLKTVVLPSGGRNPAMLLVPPQTAMQYKPLKLLCLSDTALDKHEQTSLRGAIIVMCMLSAVVWCYLVVWALLCIYVRLNSWI